MDPQFASDVEEDSPAIHTSAQEEEERSQSQVTDDINMICWFKIQCGQKLHFLPQMVIHFWKINGHCPNLRQRSPLKVFSDLLMLVVKIIMT